MFYVLLLMLVLAFITEPAITFPPWVWIAAVVVYVLRVTYSCLTGGSNESPS